MIITPMSYLLLPQNGLPKNPETRTPPKSNSAAWIVYLRIVWRDWLCLGLVALLSAGLYFTPIYYFKHRLVSINTPVSSNNTVDTHHDLRFPVDLGYPWSREPISTLACALVAVFVPASVMALFQIRLRSLWDMHAGTVGVLKAIVSTTLVCTVLKHFIGGFRPYYLNVCKPNITLVYHEIEHQRYWFNATACTGSKHAVDRALQGFPSGHSASSFAAAVFLSLYLNAKLKVFSDHASEFWAFIVILLPLIGASLVSGSMYTSHQHQAHEIVFGMIIGVVLGTLSYRAAYAAIFDFRYNHIPLPPFTIRTQFSYDQDPRFDDIGNFTEGIAEDDHLMTWSWWKHTGIQDKERRKEISWLRSIRSAKTTERELAHILDPSKQKIVVGGAEDQGRENDSWSTLDGKIHANCKRSDCEKDE